MRANPEVTASNREAMRAIPKLKVRRESVAATVSIVPMRKFTEVYGAIGSGQHEFHASENGFGIN